MKTVQEWLRNADAEKVIQNYLWEHPIKLIHIRNPERTVTEILEDARKNLRDLIQYLLTLHAASSEDGFFFASHEWEDQFPEVCAVLCMEKDILEVELPQHYLVQAFPDETKQSTTFATDARVMENGQVTIPKNVRAALGVESGDRVTFIVDGNNISVVNSEVYALMRLQEQMAGEAEKVGLFTEKDVANWIAQSRREEITEWK